MSTIKLTVNGKAVSVEAEDRTLLVHLLRENLNLTGTHVGCDTSQCGACVVHIDGRAVKSCTVLVGQANGASVTTTTALANSGSVNLDFLGGEGGSHLAVGGVLSNTGNLQLGQVVIPKSVTPERT